MQHVRVEARDVESTSANVSISLLDTPDSSSSSPSFSSSSAAPAASSSLPQPPPSNTDNVVSLRNQRDEALMANRLLKTQMQELNGEVQELSQRAKTAHAAAEKATEQVGETRKDSIVCLEIHFGFFFSCVKCKLNCWRKKRASLSCGDRVRLSC